MRMPKAMRQQSRLRPSLANSAERRACRENMMEQTHMQEAPFLELNDAAVRRAGRCILHVERFRLVEGESVALLGPNGAGKSTFIGLLTREVQPLHRDVPPVLFRGSSRATLEEVRRAVGFVSATQQAQMTVHLPVWEVAAGGLFGSLGIPKRFHVTSEQRAHVMDVLDRLGIADLAERDSTTLSSGQARRVLVARALVHDPDVLVFDEPCTGLDPQGMFYVRRTMRKVAQAGKAVVLVTHYLEDVIPEIDRVVLMKDARIMADGSKREMLTADHMSQLFDVPAEVVERDGYYSLQADY